jgi:hypothetical protein
MANGTLSSYFEKKQKGKTPEQSVGYSTAPAEPVGGPAPMGGGSAGGPSAPKAAQGGGTGFVSFGQYFGANAPAVQAQAQKQAVSAKGFEELNALQKPGGMQGGAFDTLLGGGETKREAAKQGQYRFQQLSSRLGEGRPDMTMGGKAISQAQQTKAKEDAYAQWTSNLPTQYRYNNTPEELRAMFEDEWKAGTYTEKIPGMVSTPASSL